MLMKKIIWCAKKVRPESLILFQWFHNNYLKTNCGKSHVILTTDNKLKINVKGSLISNEKIVKLLGVTVYNKLFVELHLDLICKKVSQKLHALARAYLKQKTTKGYHKVIYRVQFSSVQLWMCHSWTLNNNINKLHERGYDLSMMIGSQHSKNCLT